MFASPTANDDAGGPRVNPPGAEQSGQQTTSVGIDLISVDIFRAHVATMQLRSRLKGRRGKMYNPQVSCFFPSNLHNVTACSNMNWRGEKPWRNQAGNQIDPPREGSSPSHSFSFYFRTLSWYPFFSPNFLRRHLFCSSIFLSRKIKADTVSPIFLRRKI